MNLTVSLKNIKEFYKDEEMAFPRISDSAKQCLGQATARIIEEIGLPRRIADLFWPVDEVTLFSIPMNCGFQIGTKRMSIYYAAEIGKSEFGSYVVVCDSGALVFIDDAGPTQLINTSVETFLYFAGRFNQSKKCKFRDGDALFADCSQVDELALSNLEGMWSIVIEEARAGLY